MFMLKHVKDIRSPISAAKEKQAALIGSSSLSQRSNRDTFVRSVPKSPLRATTQPNRPNRTTVIRDSPSHLAVEDVLQGLSLFFVRNAKSTLNIDLHSGPHGVSYAVAIYPYITDQREELNVIMYVPKYSTEAMHL